VFVDDDARTTLSVVAAVAAVGFVFVADDTDDDTNNVGRADNDLDNDVTDGGGGSSSCISLS
jgi:hypothetical protein